MSCIDDVKTITLPNIGDQRGYLVVCEGLKDIPFIPKRIFYIYGTQHDITRGQHANMESEFVLINVSGNSKVKVVDTSGDSKIYELNWPHTGIYIPNMIWKDMYDFSDDSVLLCLASTHYNPQEYIKNFNEFLNYRNTHE
jgi:dTDP-4-dehydrorhamnose 3,5-epimerase-like enzyme